MLLLCHKKYKILSFLPFLLSLLPEILNALMICDILLGEEIIIERGVSDGLLICKLILRDIVREYRSFPTGLVFVIRKLL